MKANPPSLKTLEARLGITREAAGKVRALLVRAWEKGYHKEGVERTMAAISEAIGAFGSEVIRGEGPGGYWMDTVAVYVNRGDTYDTTVLYDTMTGRWYVTSWGDFVERYERRYKINPGRLPAHGDARFARAPAGLPHGRAGYRVTVWHGEGRTLFYVVKQGRGPDDWEVVHTANTAEDAQAWIAKAPGGATRPHRYRGRSGRRNPGAKRGRRLHWYGDPGLHLTFAPDDLDYLAGPGNVDQQVADWVRSERAQLAKLDAGAIRRYLGEFGAWDAAQLADDEENLHRLVWTAAGDLREERRSKAPRKNPADLGPAADRFKKFHGSKPKTVSVVPRPRLGDALVSLGTALEVNYRSHKWGGRPHNYTHSFSRENPPTVATNAEGNTLVIFGGNLKVKPEGITG